MGSQWVDSASVAGYGSLWLSILLESAVKGAVVLGLAAAAAGMMQRSAAARHLVWCLAMASLPMLPVLSAVGPDWHVLPGWMDSSTDSVADASTTEDAAAAAPASASIAARQTVDLGDRAESVRGPVEPPTAEPTSSSAVAPLEPIRPAVVVRSSPPAATVAEGSAVRELPWRAGGLLLWGAGAVVVLGPIALGMLSLWWLRRIAQRVTEGPWPSQMRDLSAQLGVCRRTILLRSDRRCMPMHWGIWRPKILLPASADSWSEQRLRLVLLHELAHVKRRDCLTHAVARLACALYWFNPLVWVAMWRIRVESEMACDDLILRSGYRGVDYAGHLLQIVANCQRDRPAAGGSIAMARRSGLECRLRAILDSRRNRRAPTRVAVMSIIALLVSIVVPVAMMQATAGEEPQAGERRSTAPADDDAPGEQPQQAAPAYDHFLYLRHNPVDGVSKSESLVLAEISPDGLRQRDLFTHRSLSIGWASICAVDGRVYAVNSGDLIAIDVATGATWRICRYVSSLAYRSGRLYAILRIEGNGCVLREFDLHGRAYRDVCPVGDEHWEPPLALSPDGKRMACFSGQDRMMSPKTFRLRLIDLKAGAAKLVGPTVGSMLFVTGGGDTTLGPTFAWLDDKTILLVRDPINQPGGAPVMMGGGPSAPMLATLAVDSGEMTDILQLPRFTRRMHDPYLRPLGDDGVPRIVLGNLGQYRIDLKTKKLIEDTTIAGPYHWVRGPEPERLLVGEKELFQMGSIPEVSVSPDGRHMAWLTNRNRSDTLVRLHTVGDEAARTVAKGWFPTLWDAFRRPEQSVFVWLDGKDLEPAKPAKPPADWQPFDDTAWPEIPQQPNIDTRLKVADYFAVALSTDQQTYRHHEQVRLTITLTNKTPARVSFKCPNGYFEPIQVIYRSSRRSGILDMARDLLPAPPAAAAGSGAPDIANRFEEVFQPDQEVVFPPGKTFRFVRLLEPPDLGENTVEATLRVGAPGWTGQAKVEPIKFKVVSSPADDELFKAKFERFFTLCRGEYEVSPSTTYHFRMLDLGPAAAPLLAAAIEDSPDPEFRQRMGYALTRIATAEVLPNYRRLLDATLQSDGRIALDGLASMIARSQAGDRALEMLLSVLGHSNASLRLGAAERLREIRDPRVAEAMQAAVADEDPRTALVAARYLAAYADIPLADWLARAAEQPTAAHRLAAADIIRKLERDWHLDFGDLPLATSKNLAEDSPRLAEYRKVLRAWEQWARENPRSSEHFFDPEREEWSR